MNQNNPSVSVIMAVRDGDAFLVNSIDSILSQTLMDFEFLIVDDASNDKSFEILKKFESSDSRIKIYSNDTPKGLPANLNFMIKKAKGRFIARMDHDDISHQNRLETQLRFMEKNKDVGLCFSDANIILDNGYFLCKKWSPSNIWLYKFMLPFYNFFIHPTAFVKREVYLNDGLYNENYLKGQDWNLWQRFYRRGTKFAVVKKTLLDYRLSIDSSSASLSSSSLHGQEYFKAIVLIRNRRKLASLKILKEIPNKLLFKYIVNLLTPQFFVLLAIMINSKFNKNSAFNQLRRQDKKF